LTGIDPADVVGIATDFTACTMVPVTADGTPLNELTGFADRPHATVGVNPHRAGNSSMQFGHIQNRARARAVASPRVRIAGLRAAVKRQDTYP
jgi:L-ribulokinase